MKTTEFIQDRKSSWIALESAIQTYGKPGEAAGKEARLTGLMKHYRRTLADLSLAQSLFPGDPLIQDLNALVVRAMILINTRPKGDLSRVAEFFSVRIPQLVRRFSGFFAISALVFSLSILAGYGLTMLNNYAGNAIVGDRYIYMTLDNIAKGKPFAVYQSGIKYWMSSYIMANNIKVAFLAFAFGALYGVGTLTILIHNGLIIGSIAAVFAQKNLLSDFTTTVMIHGTLELFAIIVAGAAGLRFGQALFRPGNRRRVDALCEFGVEAFHLCAAMVPVFIIAAILEGYVTPLELSVPARLAIIAGSLLFLFVYLGVPSLVQHFRRPEEIERPWLSLSPGSAETTQPSG